MANQANMVAAFGGSDSSYLRMSSVNGLGSVHTLNGPIQFQNTSFRSFPPSGMIGRLNSPAGMGLHSLPSSGRLQLGHAQSLSNVNDQVKFQSSTTHGNHNGSMLQRIPVPFELDQQHNKGVSHIGEFSTTIDDTSNFPLPNGLSEAKITSSSNNALTDSNNGLMLGHPQVDQCGRKFGNQSSVQMTSLKSEFCSPLPDHVSRCTDNWTSSAQLLGYQSNSLLLNDRFKQTASHPGSLRDNLPVLAQIPSNQFDVSSVTSVNMPLLDSRTDIQNQPSAMTSNAGQTTNDALIHGWDSRKQDSDYRSNIVCTSVNSFMPVNGAMSQLDQSLDSKSSVFERNMDFNLIGQPNYADPLTMKYDGIEKPSMETSLRLKQGYLLDQQRPQGNYISNTVGSLEDLVSAMMKQVIFHMFLLWVSGLLSWYISSPTYFF